MKFNYLQTSITYKFEENVDIENKCTTMQI